MTDTAFRTPETKNKAEKKVWRYLTAVPDHITGRYVCVQELDGDFGIPNEDGHDSEGWRDAEHPRSTRVIVVEMKPDGGLKNVFTPYAGNRQSQRPPA